MKTSQDIGGIAEKGGRRESNRIKFAERNVLKMKNCEYCDYCKTGETSGESAGMTLCTFTNVLFFTDFDKSQVEYLCSNITYPEYLASRESRQLPSRMGREDWKLLYKCKHPVAERIRAHTSVPGNQSA